jgi:cytochrome c-type biogenesis protein CcmH
MSALHVLHQGRRRLFIATALATLILLIIPCLSMAAEDTIERQQRLEDRFMAPCCWVQTVRHHDSEISRQMRGEIKSLIEKGRSDEQITEFFVQKYGERILASPPIVGRGSLAYWLPIGSFLVGLIGLGFVIRYWHHKRTTATVVAPQSTSSYNSQIDKEIDDFEAHD